MCQPAKAASPSVGESCSWEPANTSQGENYIETVWGRGYVLREDARAMRTMAG